MAVAEHVQILGLELFTEGRLVNDNCEVVGYEFAVYASAVVIGKRNKSPCVLTIRPATSLLGHSGRSVVVVFYQLRPIQTLRTRREGNPATTFPCLTAMERRERVMH